MDYSKDFTALLFPQYSETPQKPPAKQKLLYLKPDEVEPSDVDDSELRLYLKKCDYLDKYSIYHPGIETSPCYLPDFIAAIFERDLGEGAEEPFETKGCERYMAWRDEENRNLPHESYKESQFQYNPIAFFKTKMKRKIKKEGKEDEYDRNRHKVILKDDWEGRDWLQTRQFALMAPITYVGKTTDNKNARYLYAFAIDLDGVGMKQIERLFELMTTRFPGDERKPVPICGHFIIPTPNIIVNSGHGLHLYYTMKYPLAMHKENVRYLQAICRALYKVAGRNKHKDPEGDPGTTSEAKTQCLGIYHAFRVPESYTKPLTRTKSTGDYVGEGVPIQAWLTDVPHYSINDLMPYISFSGDDDLYKALTPAVIAELEKGGRLLNPKRLTLAQARKQYGEEWYQNRNKPKGRFTVNRRLYDWWLTKLRKTDGVKEGHRYYCIMALAAFANKCSIPFEELKNDAYGLLDSFNELTREKEPFEKKDITEALKAYHKPESVRWSPRMIEYWTDIPMRKTKRNHRKLKHHLEMARTIRDLRRTQDDKVSWNKTGNNGRKNALDKVKKWRSENPGVTNKSLCAKDLKMSRTTVTKWWNQANEFVSDSVQIADEMVFQSSLKSNKEKVMNVSDDSVQKTGVMLAKLFAPGSDYTVEGLTHEELLEAVTTGKWRELNIDLLY